MSDRRTNATLPGVAGVLLAGVLAMALAGCGSASLPSQTGNLATLGAATPGAAPAASQTKPRFNPFVENESGPGRRVVINNPSLAEVLQAGPLPERVLGRADAPVTVVKYASMTCPYCRKFHAETFPRLKKRYIDTGRMRFILREFPIGFQSGAATIALRCVPPDKYFAAYGALLEAQSRWVSQDVRREPIWRVVKRFGLTRDQFDACYEDEALIAGLRAVKDRGRTLGVIGTPNFFIGNKLEKRVLTMTDFDAIMAPGGAVAARAGQ